MARKSRKNIMPQSAAPEIRISEEVNLLRTAAYARLSSENSGHETEDTLNTQILQIHSYIKEHPGLTLTDTYVDNGFTGTNFDRPEFERMMQDVRTGKIQCIVVKDLSRFGRDYIETGNYGEMVFCCGHKRSVGKFSHCYSGYYREQAVNSRVARAIKTVFTALEVVNQGMQEKKSITLQCVDVDDLKKQAEMIRAEQIKLYESYADGILTRNEYLEKKKGLGEKLADLQEKIRIEEEEQETADELDEEIRSLTKQASQKTYIGGLTKECVDAFVSMVYLYDDQTMKVEFNCEDVIRRALEKYGA